MAIVHFTFLENGVRREGSADINPGDPNSMTMEQLQQYIGSQPGLSGFSVVGAPGTTGQPTSTTSGNTSGSPNSIAGGYAGIDLVGPTGEKINSNNYNEIQTKLSDGYTVLNSAGEEVPSEQFQGGWLIAGVPINTVLTGTIDPAQHKALSDAGKWKPEYNSKAYLGYFEDTAAKIGLTPENSPQIFSGLNTVRQQYGFTGPTAGSTTPPPAISGGPPPVSAGSGNPPPGGGTTTPPGTTTTPPDGGATTTTGTGGAAQLPPFDATQYKNPTDLLNALLNRTAGAGQTGSAAYNQLIGGINGGIDTAKDVSGANYSIQRQLYDMITGKVSPALDTAMGQQGQDLSSVSDFIMRNLYPSLQTSIARGDQGQDLSPNARYIQGNLYPSIQTAVAQGQQTGLSQEAKNIQDNLYPSIQAAVARGEQGLSPEAMAALRTQAMEAVPQNFARIEQDLRTQLARRGAIGSNEMPGSAGDIVREFGDLAAQKEGLRSSLMSNAALSNEQALQQNRSRAMDALNLGSSYIQNNEQATQANRDRALQAIGLGNQQAGMLEQGFQSNQGNALQALGLGQQQAGVYEQAFQQNQGTGLSAAQIANQLLGTGGALFDPSAWLSTQNQLFGQVGQAIGGQNQSQQNASGTMAGLGQSRVDLEPESLRNLLLSGLMGIGGAGLSGYLAGRGGGTPAPAGTTGGTTGGGGGIDWGAIFGGLGNLGGGGAPKPPTGGNCWLDGNC